MAQPFSKVEKYFGSTFMKMFQISYPSRIETPIELRDIAKKHGVTVSELKDTLKKKSKNDHKKEKIRIKKRNKQMEFLLTNKLPMDCVNEILGYMPLEIRAGINKLLIKDKIERIPEILSTMELKHIMRHINYGRLQFIKTEAIDSETYDRIKYDKDFSEWRDERWRVYLHEVLASSKSVSDYDRFNEHLDKNKKSVYASVAKFYSDPNKYYKIYYDGFQNNEKDKVRKLSYHLKWAFEHMFDSIKRESEEERHQKLNKMLDLFMRLPSTFSTFSTFKKSGAKSFIKG